MNPADNPHLGSRRFIAMAFAAVGVGCLAVTIFAIARTRSVERSANELVQDMLTSIRLLARMERDVDQEQILADAHVFEKQAAELATLEAEIGHLKADLSANAQAYDPWATLPGERAVWDRARADLEAVKAPMTEALSLSRQGQDAEARNRLVAIGWRMARIHRDFDELIAINDHGATESLARISAMRFELLLTFLSTGLATLVGVFLVGRWSIRQVASREVQMARYSRMLEERNRDLDGFAGRVAHDIRGPLSTINLAAAVLTKTSPQQSEITKRLLRGVQQMEALVPRHSSFDRLA